MKETALSQYSSDATATMLGQIPFFTDLAIHDRQQYALLLANSSIIELASKENIIRKGETDTRFYFLLKGKLDVFPDTPCKEMPISQLSAGQVLGALSIINNQPRNASLSAATQGTMLLATDFTVFGQLEDFSQVKLETKLSLLRIVVNNTRWKLEVYKMNEPTHRLVDKLNAVENFTGEKNSLTELHFLVEQSKQLGQILAEWNNAQLANMPSTTAVKKGRLFSLIDNLRNSFN